MWNVASCEQCHLLDILLYLLFEGDLFVLPGVIRSVQPALHLQIRQIMLKLANWRIILVKSLYFISNLKCCPTPFTQSVLKNNLGLSKALLNIQVSLVDTCHNSLTVFHRELDVVEGFEFHGSDPVPDFVQFLLIILAQRNRTEHEFFKFGKGKQFYLVYGA
jgi:hypothetical protein